MAYAVTSKRKSEGNDNTEKISDQIFKKLNAIYFIPDDRIKWVCWLNGSIMELIELKSQGKDNVEGWFGTDNHHTWKVGATIAMIILVSS